MIVVNVYYTSHVLLDYCDTFVLIKTKAGVDVNKLWFSAGIWELSRKELSGEKCEEWNSLKGNVPEERAREVVWAEVFLEYFTGDFGGGPANLSAWVSGLPCRITNLYTGSGCDMDQ